MHRTEQNNPLGLEVQVHVPEATCSALSEPGITSNSINCFIIQKCLSQLTRFFRVGDLIVLLKTSLHFFLAGLRALLRFMTGMYVCMNRDVGPRSMQVSSAYEILFWVPQNSGCRKLYWLIGEIIAVRSWSCRTFNGTGGSWAYFSVHQGCRLTVVAVKSLLISTICRILSFKNRVWQMGW